MSQDVVSFVLRFVREAGEEQQARWRGHIKHVQGTTEQQFSQFSDALGFMQNHMNDVVEASFSGAKKNPVLETAKLWGELFPQMNKLVLSSVTDAVKGGTGQMEQAFGMLNPWLASANDVAKLEQKLDEVQKQLSQLTRLLEEEQAKPDARASAQKKRPNKERK